MRAATFEAPRCGAAWTRETREMEKRASSTTATDLEQKFLRTCFLVHQECLASVSRAEILPLVLSKKMTTFEGEQGDSYRPAVEK